jgi:hypothetical protein
VQDSLTGNAHLVGLMLLLFSSVSYVDKVFPARLACYFSSMLRIVMNILSLEIILPVSGS